MRFTCEIDNVKTLKKGMKITLAIEDDNVKSVLKEIYNFMDKFLIVDFEVNTKLENEKLDMITPQQRKKIYALISDIADGTGANKAYTKENLKKEFLKENIQYEIFSLSTCGKVLASDFIEFLLIFAFEYGVELQEHPKNIIDDIERYIAICLKQEICCICGRDSEEHHLEGSRIGMGNNRKKVDNEGREVIPLCRIHHSELHNMSEYDFLEKYHLGQVNQKD